MLLTRKEYDSLMLAYPYYMLTAWLKLHRKWFLGGVRVEGTIPQLEKLKNLLDSL